MLGNRQRYMKRPPVHIFATSLYSWIQSSWTFLFFFALLELAPPVFYHIWTQDSHIVHLSYEYKMGPYIVQGRSKPRVWNFDNKKQNFHDFWMLNVYAQIQVVIASLLKRSGCLSVSRTVPVQCIAVQPRHRRAAPSHGRGRRRWRRHRMRGGHPSAEKTERHPTPTPSTTTTPKRTI